MAHLQPSAVISGSETATLPRPLEIACASSPSLLYSSDVPHFTTSLTLFSSSSFSVLFSIVLYIVYVLTSLYHTLGRNDATTTVLYHLTSLRGTKQRQIMQWFENNFSLIVVLLSYPQIYYWTHFSVWFYIDIWHEIHQHRSRVMRIRCNASQ